VLQCVAVFCSVLQRVAVCRVAVCCRAAVFALASSEFTVCCSVLQCVAVCCRVLQCVAVCHSVLPCVIECCSVLLCVAVRYLPLCWRNAALTLASSEDTVCCRVLQCVIVCCGVVSVC